jgi:3-dehydroquinate synthase
MRENGIDEPLFIITNPWIEKRYGPVISKSFREKKIKFQFILIPPGEKYKTLEMVNRIYTQLIQKKAERKSVLVSLGGGVVGDITGFVAATYLRGVDLIHIPTTLLAQLDSSIGGKTGVNHALGKNLIGAFYHPKFVLVDPLLLKSLSSREITAALGEVLKYAVIWNRETFHTIEMNFNALRELQPGIIEEVIASCIQIKARVVEEDEKESYLRQILNFGHTFGHAMESVTKYRRLLHGEAVTLGILAASYISKKRYWLGADDFERIVKLGVPLLHRIRLPQWDVGKLLQDMKVDKKVRESKLHFVLPKEIGRVEIVNDVTTREIKNAIQYLNTLFIPK